MTSVSGTPAPPSVSTPPSEPPSAPPSTPWPSAAKGWWAVAILSLAYTLSFIDRTIISLVIEPIKADLNLTDTQIALLQGLAFGLFYAVMGLPLGWLVDKMSRRRLIAGAITFWCLMTAACGAASHFWHLFIARTGVGAGEAGLSPAAISMISDFFPPERRALPIGVYSAASAAGAGLALVLGGMVVAAISKMPPQTLPLFGPVSAWQAVFILVGLAGLVIALLMLTVTEPVRQAGPPKTETQAAPVTDTLMRHIRMAPGFFVVLTIGMALYTALVYAILSWTPAALMRGFGWGPGEVGMKYGMIVLICGASGTIFGGWLCGLLQRRGVRAAALWISGLTMIAAGPALALAASATQPTMALALFAPAMFIFTMPGGLAIAAIQQAVSSAVRGRASAAYYLVLGIVGLALGPLTVALLTDHLFQNPAAVGRSLAVTAMIYGPISGLLVLLTIRPFRRLIG